MVKLASAREIRMYGPRRARNRSEYINASLYVFATIVLGCGLASQWTSEARSGLVLAMVGLVIIVLVNVHDLAAHLAGIDYRFSLMEFDLQLALVEFAGPLIFAVGTLLFSLATFFLFIQVALMWSKTWSYSNPALNLVLTFMVVAMIGDGLRPTRFISPYLVRHCPNEMIKGLDLNTHTPHEVIKGLNLITM